MSVMLPTMSCASTQGDGERVAGAPCVAPELPGRFFWFLVHPTNAPPDGAGIYLHDERAADNTCKLDLPAELGSPHALAYDGKLLWVGGYRRDAEAAASASGLVFAIDPASGEVIRKLAPDVFPEGLAVEGDTLWVGGTGPLRRSCPAVLARIDHDGNMLEELCPESSVVQDVTLLDDRLFYAVNDDTDRIVEIMADGTEHDVVQHAGSQALYTLTSRLGLLVVEGDGVLHAFDPDTGEAKQTLSHAVPGWITAIAPANDP